MSLIIVFILALAGIPASARFLNRIIRNKWLRKYPLKKRRKDEQLQFLDFILFNVRKP